MQKIESEKLIQIWLSWKTSLKREFLIWDLNDNGEPIIKKANGRAFLAEGEARTKKRQEHFGIVKKTMSKSSSP